MAINFENNLNLLLQQLYCLLRNNYF